jgi:hypothetical protein
VYLIFRNSVGCRSCRFTLAHRTLPAHSSLVLCSSSSCHIPLAATQSQQLTQPRVIAKHVTSETLLLTLRLSVSYLGDVPCDTGLKIIFLTRVKEVCAVGRPVLRQEVRLHEWRRRVGTCLIPAQWHCSNSLRNKGEKWKKTKMEIVCSQTWSNGYGGVDDDAVPYKWIARVGHTAIMTLWDFIGCVKRKLVFV